MVVDISFSLPHGGIYIYVIRYGVSLVTILNLDLVNSVNSAKAIQIKLKLAIKMKGPQ